MTSQIFSWPMYVHQTAMTGLSKAFKLAAAEVSELQPHRDLDPKRLRLSGCGHWDTTQYFSDQLVLVLPYQEPAVFRLCRVRHPWKYRRLRDGPATILELAELWDANSLTRLGRYPRL